MPGRRPCICTRLHRRPDASRGVVARAVRDRCDVFRGRALVTTPDTRHNSPGDTTLAAPAVRERGLLNQAGMDARRRRARLVARVRSAQGFSLIELLIVVAIIAILAGIAIGVTPGVIRTARASPAPRRWPRSSAAAREMAISRRRNIQVTFVGPTSSTLGAGQRARPGHDRAREPVSLEGRVEYRASAASRHAGRVRQRRRHRRSAAPLPAMFTLGGHVRDVNGDPTNATIQSA